jgi:hypothetical protein
LDIPRLLPHMIVSDVEHGRQTRFRIRIAGTYFEAAVGQKLAGTYVGECAQTPVETNERLLAEYRRCVASGAVIASRGSFASGSRTHLFERLLLPLAGDVPDRVDIIFSALRFAEPGPIGHAPFTRR